MQITTLAMSRNYNDMLFWAIAFLRAGCSADLRDNVTYANLLQTYCLRVLNPAGDFPGSFLNPNPIDQRLWTSRAFPVISV